MSGILNSKQRFVDTVITAEGRRQLASGEFQIEFATFTDRDVFYGEHPDSGSIDMSNQIQLEAPSSSPADIITLETNLFGNVVGEVTAGVLSGSGDRANLSGAFTIRNGQIFQSTNGHSKNLITGEDYESLVNGILNDSIKNFDRLETIGTLEPLMEDPEFRTSRSRVNFELNNRNANDICSVASTPIELAENIFADRHLAHLPNFKYLPPRNKSTSSSPTGSLLFDYPDNSQVEAKTLDEIENELKFLPVQEIDFTNTSRANNLVCQLFETSGNSITKLSAIDFGSFPTGDPNKPTKRYFFVGRVIPKTLDPNGTTTYVNMFTLEFN